MSKQIPKSILDALPDFDEEKFDYFYGYTLKDSEGLEMFNPSSKQWSQGNGDSWNIIYRKAKPKPRYELIDLEDQQPGDEWTLLKSYPIGFRKLKEGVTLGEGPVFNPVIIRRRITD